MLFKIKDIGDDGLEVDLPVTTAWLAEQCPDLGAKPGLGGLAAARAFWRRAATTCCCAASCAACWRRRARAASTRRASTLDIPLTVSFVEKGADGDADEDDDDGDVVYFDGGEIDLGAELRDEILLAMPINPLCQEGCLGLCSVCGGNRNQSPCDCEDRQREVTSKLSALGKIKL